MDFSKDTLILYVVGSLVLIEICALILLYRLRRSKTQDRKGSANLASVKLLRPLGQEGVLEEINRLRAGGDLDEALLKSLSSEDKALFEVTLIDALADLPREQQHRLRATLVKHGYDEHCARRLVRAEISDRVRASTLLNLLRPQTTGQERETTMPEPPLPQVRKAKSGGSGPGNKG
jgi:hypothetical protein